MFLGIFSAWRVDAALIYQTNTGTADQSRFYRTDVPETCQLFTGVDGEIDTIVAKLKNVTLATGTIHAQLWAWGGSATTGPMLATSDYDAATIGVSMEDVTFTLTAPYTVSAAVTYCVAFLGDTPEGVHFIRHGGTTGTPQQWFYDGASWNDTTNAQANIALYGPDPEPEPAAETVIVDMNRDVAYGVFACFAGIFLMMYSLKRI